MPLPIPRVNPPGWAMFEILSSADITQMDLNIQLLDQYVDSIIIRRPWDALAHGVVGDGTVDDITAINAAMVSIQALGGGELHCPPTLQFYRITNKLVMQPDVKLSGVPGATVFKMDHATNKTIAFDSGTWVEEGEIYGIAFEAAQANTGDLIYMNPAAPTARLRMTKCSANISALLYTRALLNNSAAVPVTLEDCEFVSAVTINQAAMYPAGKTTFIRGIYTMAPAAIHAMFDQTNVAANDLVLEDVIFKQISTGGNIAFVNLFGGRCEARGCRYQVDDSGAGSGTYAFSWGGGSAPIMNIDDDNDFATVSPYKATQVVAVGSYLKRDAYRYTNAGTSDITVPNDVAVAVFRSAKTTCPSVAFPLVRVPGQSTKVLVFNDSGVAWTGAGSASNFSGNAAHYTWVTVPANGVLGYSVIANDLYIPGTQQWLIEAVL